MSDRLGGLCCVSDHPDTSWWFLSPQPLIPISLSLPLLVPAFNTPQRWESGGKFSSDTAQFPEVGTRAVFRAITLIARSQYGGPIAQNPEL